MTICCFEISMLVTQKKIIVIHWKMFQEVFFEDKTAKFSVTNKFTLLYLGPIKKKQIKNKTKNKQTNKHEIVSLFALTLLIIWMFPAQVYYRYRRLNAQFLNKSTKCLLIFISLWYHAAEMSSKKEVHSWGFKNLSHDCQKRKYHSFLAELIMIINHLKTLIMVLD